MDIARRARELDPLAARWRSLEESAPLPTQSAAWVWAGARTLAAAGRLHVVVTRSAAGGAAAAAPLVVTGRRGVRRLELLGVFEISEPSDLLSRDADAARALVRRLARSGLPLRLDRVPAESATVPAVREAYGGRGLVRCRPVQSAPVLELDEGWTDPEARLSSRRRSDLRRARRRAEQTGSVTAEVHAPGPADLAPLLEEAFAVEARSWRAARQGALAQDPLRGLFFRDLAARAAADGILRICFLRVGARAAAMQIATAFADAFWLLKVGFDEELSACSPGTLLIAETIRHAAEQGLARYEFLGVVEPWTRMWTKRERACVSVRAYPVGVAGLAALADDAVAALRHRLRRPPA